jgi:hypothetical protein
MHGTARSLALCLAVLMLSAPPGRAHDSHASEGEELSHVSRRSDFIPMNYPPPFGLSLSEGWLDPWPHSHFSPRGTPYVHLFNLEPAYMDRDLFFFYSHTREEDQVEREFEIELEWAFTRRIGMVLELPLVEIDPKEGRTERGLGDLAIAPRLLLIDTPRFLFSGNFEVHLPTGSRRRGLGSGEVSVAPSISTWLDLGNWFALQTQVGVERGLRSRDSELFYAAGLTYSFLGPALVRESPHHRMLGHMHYPPGLASLIFEAIGRTELRGEDRGHTVGEILFGLGYSITDSLELRGGYQFPVGGRREIEERFLINLIYHF